MYYYQKCVLILIILASESLVYFFASFSPSFLSFPLHFHFQTLCNLFINKYGNQPLSLSLSYNRLRDRLSTPQYRGQQLTLSRSLWTGSMTDCLPCFHFQNKHFPTKKVSKSDEKIQHSVKHPNCVCWTQMFQNVTSLWCGQLWKLTLKKKFDKILFFINCWTVKNQVFWFKYNSQKSFFRWWK